VPPEPYMTRRRQALFIFYAITSYIYRWVVTFSILYFLYTFLKPYKLGSISYLLGTGALASMVGMPLYQLGKSIHKRGRLPDMKPVRVWLTVGVFAAVLVVVMLIPFPMRVKGLALVQVRPDEKSSMKVVAPETGGFLRQVLVEDGQRVRAGDTLAVLENPDLETKIKVLEKLPAVFQKQISAYQAQAGNAEMQLGAARNELAAGQQEYLKRRAQADKLRIKAPCDGVIMLPPKAGVRLHKEDAGKYVEGGSLLCVVGDPKALRAVLFVEPSDVRLIQTGDKAWIRLHGRGYNYWRGTVSGISAVEAKEIPPQLSARAGGDIPTQTDPQTQAEVPQMQHYPIAVSFDEIDDAVHPGTLGRVKIESAPHTLWWRLNRYLRTTFNWGL
jgi:putative peptide zinc metalloprotease protein